MKLSTLSVVLSCLLVGCQAPQFNPDKALVQHASNKAAHISKTQQQLYLDGVINQHGNGKPATFYANSDLLSVHWDGDAVELLAQLARQRGLNFGYTGVRLPLPVSVHVSNITFKNLLRQLETQIGWRATLKQQPLELHLYFALPDKGGRLA